MVKKMMPLRDFAMNVVKTSTSKIPKERLNNVTVAVLFRERKDKWTEASNFGEETEIDKVGITSWFSYPEFDETRQKMEPKCLDAHHLLVNLRSKVCKDGVSGIRKEAWHKVAESNSDIISRGIVVDLLDKQNNAFAKKTFSLAVENEMKSLNYLEEAKFCRLVRRWYDAEDSAGHSATERIRMKLDLKEYLLKDVDFGIFPPPGMYIKGFPKIMFEGFLQRIDTSIQLYSIINSRSYNHRSLSSLVNETFFGELSELEPTKLGCPKAITIPRLMSNVTEMQHFRCDPSERAFHICTTRRSVYPTRKLLPSAENLDTEMNENASDSRGEKGMILPRYTDRSVVRCCPGYILNGNSICVDCPNGTFGVDCKETCQAYFYGFRCKSKCNCNSSETCDKAFGCVPYTTTPTDSSINTINDGLDAATAGIIALVIIVLILGSIIIFWKRSKIIHYIPFVSKRGMFVPRVQQNNQYEDELNPYSEIRESKMINDMTDGLQLSFLRTSYTTPVDHKNHLSIKSSEKHKQQNIQTLRESGLDNVYIDPIDEPVEGNKTKDEVPDSSDDQDSVDHMIVDNGQKYDALDKNETFVVFDNTDTYDALHNKETCDASDNYNIETREDLGNKKICDAFGYKETCVSLDIKSTCDVLDDKEAQSALDNKVACRLLLETHF